MTDKLHNHIAGMVCETNAPGKPADVTGDLITSAAHDRAIAEAVKAERERCAKLCDRIAGNTADFTAEKRRAAGMCAASIRALAAQEGGDATG